MRFVYMKGINLVLCFFFFYLLGFFVLRSHAGQGEGFLHYFKAKLQLKLDREVTPHSFNDFYSTDRRLISIGKAIPMTKHDHHVLVNSQKGLKKKDKINMLPGQPYQVNFSQYGGYVTVDKTAGRALFYYFVEATGSKDDKPLLLWLNGGPGCSSFGYGAMSELGPFRVCSDGKTLFENTFAWNRAANVLFLESPAGVGYSYSNKTSDYHAMGDRKTADDSYVFLLNWLERFPEYKNREFYIAGESYAGHYVPQLAQTILINNKSAKKKHFINLKGIAMGNAVLTNQEESLSSAAQYEFLWSHALISDKMIKTFRKTCDYSLIVSERSDECLQTMVDSMNLLKHLNKYNIYASNCRSARVTTEPKQANIESFDPCTENYVKAYLNRPDVQTALHANVTGLKYTWISCSTMISSAMWTDSADTILPLLSEFMSKGIRVLVFSGDLDAIIPIACTRDILSKFKLTEKTAWYPWNVAGQVGGYSVEYKNGFTFASVRGAGHEVPSYQPRRAFVLIKSFLDGKPLPKFTHDDH